MNRGNAGIMDSIEETEANEAEPDARLASEWNRPSLDEEPFVGAYGLSPTRELMWAIGLAEIDHPCLWEPA